MTNPAYTSFMFRDPHTLRRERLLLATFVGVSVLLHALVLAGLPGLSDSHDEENPRPLDVRLREPDPPKRIEPPRPEPVRPEPQRQPVAKTPPAPPVPQPAPTQPVLAARDARADAPTITAPSVSAPVVPQEPVPAPKPAVVAAEKPVAPTPVTQPLFNAAYLKNTPPRYPVSARRNGEQGTVMLKVLVTREGSASTVNVERSSGSRALDTAAVETVKGWRFVPAKQGEQPVEAWVLVPVEFRLDQAS